MEATKTTAEAATQCPYCGCEDMIRRGRAIFRDAARQTLAVIASAWHVYDAPGRVHVVPTRDFTHAA